MANNWTINNMPNLDGKTAVVTGANSGLGHEITKALAARGAHVVMACRSLDKAQAAASDVRQHVPTATLDLMALDLADLDSVREFAAAFQQKYDALDLLINNAGVMAIPRRETADGFEMQFGTNHLGHFALTGLLLNRLLAAPDARVVNVSSVAHRSGTINFEDLNRRQSYKKWEVYSQSKLANLLFTYELQRKLEASGVDAVAVAAHPGWAETNLQAAGPQMEGNRLMQALVTVGNKLFAQSATQGALPILYAAVAANLDGGDYIGPDKFGGMRGYPTKEKSNEESYNQAVAARLWQESEQLTGVRYEALAGTPVVA